jgi:hypothetical protein
MKGIAVAESLRTHQTFEFFIHEIIRLCRLISYGLDLSIRKERHLQQQPPVPEAADVGAPVGAFPIPDRHFSHFKVEFGSPEDEIKISKGIEVSEIVSTRLDLLVVLAKECLGATQGVFESLIENPCKHEREELVP